MSFAFSGLHLGSILGLLVSPVIIDTFGWPSLFFLLGGIGAVQGPVFVKKECGLGGRVKAAHLRPSMEC